MHHKAINMTPCPADQAAAQSTQLAARHQCSLFALLHHTTIWRHRQSCPYVRNITYPCTPGTRRLSFPQLIGFGLSLFSKASNQARLNLLAKGLPGLVAMLVGLAPTLGDYYGTKSKKQ